MKSTEQEVTQGSILALPVAILALILIYNYTKLLPLFTNVGYVLSSFVSPASRVQTSTENASADANIRKKARPKKIQ